MSRQNQSIGWEEVEEGELRKWYYIGKIFGQILPGSFPLYTFEELWLQVTQDPEYKKEEE